MGPDPLVLSLAFLSLHLQGRRTLCGTSASCLRFSTLEAWRSPAALPPSQVLLNSLQLGSHSWRMNIPTFKMETVILPGKGLFNICLDTIDKWFLYNDFGPQFSQTKVFFLLWLRSLSFPLILVMPPRCSPAAPPPWCFSLVIPLYYALYLMFSFFFDNSCGNGIAYILLKKKIPASDLVLST